MQKSLSVLVVEDEALIAWLLSETLEDLGHTVCAVASTEAEAVAQALACQPDLMFVDAGLSAGNGVAAVETILMTRFVPHVFVTGNWRKVREQRPDAVILEKPFFVPQLVQAIDQALAVPSQS